MLYVFIIVALAAGFGLGLLVRSLLAASAEAALREELSRSSVLLRQAEDDRRSLADKDAEVSRLSQECAALRARLKGDDEVKAALETQKQVMEAEFRRLAASVLESNSRTFADANRQELDKVVAPLKERLTEFGNLVSKTYTDSAKEQFSLKEEIAKLVASSQRVSDDARKLTDALRGNNKVQGEWGEHILETMLENCGLVKGREFDTQETLRGADGKSLQGDGDKRMRPDVIVHYPDKTDIIIDSKASLTAYMSYLEATTDDARDAAARAHVASVRRHVGELATKSYQDYARSVDFVMMFIPNDSAYMLAMQTEPRLWMEAYERRVMIVAPSHLVSVLKMVSVLWRRDEQNANTMRIAKLGGDLYVKMSAFCESMDKVGKGLDMARTNYDEAVKRLSTGRDNAIRKLEQLRAMGIETRGKRLPERFAEGNEVEAEDNPQLPDDEGRETR